MTTTDKTTGYVQYNKQTTTGSNHFTYGYNNGACHHMLPCGHCTLLGYKCPYYGSIDPIRYDKVTC